jgi:microsomal dipeptidase-like Zn-dependent dipeptidase
VRLSLTAVLAVAALGILGVALPSIAAAAGGKGPTRYTLANRCWALRSAGSGKFVTVSADRYHLTLDQKGPTAALYLKPTRLGAYLLYDQDRKLMTREGGSAVGRAGHPSKQAVWAPKRSPQRAFEIASTQGGKRLAISRGGELVLKPPGKATRLMFERTDGCKRYPEARVDAAGKSFKGTLPNGAVKGFADAHLHITADMRAGGNVIFGRSFAPLGITRALSANGDAREHGPDGSLDVTGNLLRSGSPFGTHDTHGWPTFAGWPVHDTVTHQQTYYVWLKRMWKAGMRVVVAQTVEDEPLCKLEPTRTHSCDETAAIKLEIKRLKKLEHYVDAQSGGPGKGWFRIVRNPSQARRAIKRGKLAVLIGIESSDLFGCSEFMGQPQCTRADIDKGLREYKKLGVRTMFVAHWVDNAFSGAALEGGSTGSFINILEALQTGQYFKTAPCPEPGQGEDVTPLGTGVLKFLRKYFPAAGKVIGIPIPAYPAGKQCNAKGLTDLGHYLIRRLMANHMLIEMDHMSERARLTVLDMAEKRDYPLVSSHTNTGGLWTPTDLRRLYALKGYATARPDQAPQLAKTIVTLCGYQGAGHNAAVGLGTDTGGFNSLPGPSPDAGSNPLKYPFHSYAGGVKFTPEKTGQRTFNINNDGVAQYGLFADLLAQVQRAKDGKKALPALFRSAQAYLDTWRAAERHG